MQLSPSRLAAVLVAATSLAASLALAPVALARPAVRGPVADPRHSFGRSTSTNWSGYDVTGSGATHVVGSWKAPAVTCSPGENSWSSPWVGIDGDTSNTVEQIGTDSDCVSGAPRYYAWYEMYPKSLVQLSMPVTPGHSYTGEVTALAGGQYVLKLTDDSAKASFTTTQTNKRARQASIEWIMEGPSSGVLSDFGSVSFTNPGGTINGQTAALGAFAGTDPITMVTNQGVARAVPSAIAGNSSFSVTWQHA
jgi:Peptidase A4 family